MSFEYVLSLLKLKGQPPTGKKLHSFQGKYHFYPFHHEGLILTADFNLWKIPKESEKRKIIIDFPGLQEIENFFSEKPEIDDWVLIALSDQKFARTIDSVNSVQLSTIPDELKNVLSTRFLVAGFDVIDTMHISALGDIGYTLDDIDILKNIPVEISAYGLISNDIESYRFSKYASRIAQEHSPFFPVKICVFSRN